MGLLDGSGVTFEELPDLLTREEIMRLTGISAATFTRRMPFRVDRRTLSDAELARFGKPTEERRRQLPRLYRKRDARGLLSYTLETHQHQSKWSDPDLVPFLVAASWVLRRSGWMANMRDEARRAFDTWVKEHRLLRGQCVFRDGPVTIWAARWTVDGLADYGWYRKVRSSTVWSAAVIRQEEVPLEGGFRAIPCDEWAEPGQTATGSRWSEHRAGQGDPPAHRLAPRPLWLAGQYLTGWGNPSCRANAELAVLFADECARVQRDLAALVGASADRPPAVSRGGRIHGIAGWSGGQVRGASGSTHPRGDHAVDRHLRRDVHPFDARAGESSEAF